MTYEFKVGDRVRFKKEHLYYVKRNGCPLEFEITAILPSYVREATQYVEGAGGVGAFNHRLEPMVLGKHYLFNYPARV